MKQNTDELEYGPVFVSDGEHKGRIGYYDNDETIFTAEELKADIDDDVEGTPGVIIYFGSPGITRDFYLMPATAIRAVTTQDLMERRETLSRSCYLGGMRGHGRKYVRDLQELHYVDTTLIDRMIDARYRTHTKGRNVFISHSSLDKTFARWISTDLKAAGHSPWLDEWKIKVGESIPEKIGLGLAEADFVLVVLSDNSTQSKWVEREWQTKYWAEVQSGKIKVLPILLKDCEIPELLKIKKYADFRNNYNDGLDDVLSAIHSLDGSP
ncbi:toll/interleukin-1 receptor domain-containing protein [Stenotrophomonas humi]